MNTKGSSKGLLVCTVGPRATDSAIYPVREKLCDYIIYTHVTVLKNRLGDSQGLGSLWLFLKTAKANKNSGSTKFGVSLSPSYVTSNGDYLPAYDAMMEDLHKEDGIVAHGVLGASVGIGGLETQPELTSWLQGMSKGLAAIECKYKKLFVGLRLETSYPSLRLASSMQAEFAQTLQTQLESLKVGILVLMTHAQESGRSGTGPCITVPAALLSRPGVEETPDTAQIPDLETSARLLSLFNSTTTRTLLSTTLAAIRYSSKTLFSREGTPFGKPCQEGNKTSYLETCKRSSWKEMTAMGLFKDIMSPWQSWANTLLSYDNTMSLGNKETKKVQVI
ncbi:uncharacterized protein ISCGN_024261 [Ixodes scapularis]